MPKCSVKKCKSNTLSTLKKDGVSYFRFPKNDIEREKWRQIIANERGEDFFKPNDSSVVCSCHFSENDMYFTKKGYRKINKGVLPCIETDISTTSTLSQINVVSATASTLGSLRNEPSTSRTDIIMKAFLNAAPPTASTTVSLRNEPSPASDTTLESQLNSEVDTIKNERSEISDRNNLFDLQLQTEKQVIGHTQPVSQQEHATEHLINQRSSSPTSSGSTSILDTPKTSYYKKKLRICQKSNDLKTKQIQNLKKKNKRLMKRNINLREIVADLKKKRLVDESFSNDLTKKINKSNAKVIEILTAKKKVCFTKYPPELRKFALTLHFYSPEAYKYLRDVFAQNLPHPNTLLTWYRNVNAQPVATIKKRK